MEEKDRFKKFQEAEKKRYRAEQQRFEMKHSKQLEEARAGSQAAVKELEQLQNEKRKMLMEHETSKLKELDESYAKEFKDWKADLKPRKQLLEETLGEELDAQAAYYTREEEGEEPSWAQLLQFSYSPSPSSVSRSLRGGERRRSRSTCLPPTTSSLPSSPLPSLSSSRPSSLYVPFRGLLPSPPAPPGQAARAVLQALSYAPTHESYGGDPSSPISQQAPSPSPLPLRASHYSPKLRSKASSFSSLLSSSPLSSRPSTPLSRSSTALLSTRTASPPLVAPTHPSQHASLSALLVTHPPVLHPPPDLVTSSLLHRSSSRHSTSHPSLSASSPLPWEVAPSLTSIREASPHT